VPVLGDAAYETDETFFVALSHPTNASIARSRGTGTITNDDPAPVLSINNVTQAEGTSGSTSFVFTVSLSGATELPATVHFATADGTATVADGDYVGKSGTLTFSPGQTSKTIVVTVHGDTDMAPDETFYVNLSNPTNSTLGTAQGIGTMQDGAGHAFQVSESARSGLAVAARLRLAPAADLPTPTKLATQAPIEDSGSQNQDRGTPNTVELRGDNLIHSASFRHSRDFLHLLEAAWSDPSSGVDDQLDDLIGLVAREREVLRHT
jgi:hypothetical protein